jgi:hypothetical protein
MGRREGVVDVHVRQSGERARERVLVGFLLRVKAQVLEEHHLARPEGAGALLHLRPHAVRQQRHRAAQQRFDPLGHRAKRVLRIGFSLGAPEMGGEDQRGTPLEAAVDGRTDRGDARVVRHPCALQGHVEVGPQEDALPGQIELIDDELRHG